MSITIKLVKDNREHQKACTCRKDLLFYYQRRGDGNEAWGKIDKEISLTITEQSNTDVIIKALLPKDNQPGTGDESKGDQVFCINGIKQGDLKAKWKDNSDTDKKWEISLGDFPTATVPIPLSFCDGYKMQICIEYKMKPNAETHILCRKENGKTMHVLGPIDDEDKDPSDPNKHLKALIDLNEGEIIHCVGVKGKDTIEPNIFINRQNVKGYFRIDKIGNGEKIWEITLEEADDKQCISNPQTRNINQSAPTTNVSMGVDEPDNGKKEIEEILHNASNTPGNSPLNKLNKTFRYEINQG